MILQSCCPGGYDNSPIRKTETNQGEGDPAPLLDIVVLFVFWLVRDCLFHRAPFVRYYKLLAVIFNRCLSADERAE